MKQVCTEEICVAQKKVRKKFELAILAISFFLALDLCIPYFLMYETECVSVNVEFEHAGKIRPKSVI